MRSFLKLTLLSVLLISLLLQIKAAGTTKPKHLECWHCSSDTYGSKDFCDIVFQEDSIPNDLLKVRNINVVRSCNSTINSDYEMPVCRKTVEEANGKTITKRFCYYSNKSDPLDHCANRSSKKNVRQIFCQDCLTDKCNSAGKISTMLCIFSLPVLLAKLIAPLAG